MNEHDDAYREVQDNRAINDARSYFGAGQPPAAAAVPAMPAAPAAAGEQPAAPPATGVAAGEPSVMQQPQAPQTRSFADSLKAVAKDVGWGAVEAVPQYAIGGRMDFYKNYYGMMLSAAQGLGSWAEKVGIGTPDPNAVPLAEQKKQWQEQYGPDFLQKFTDFADIGQPTTTTGMLFRKAGEFMQGYKLPTAVAGKAGAGLPAMVASPLGAAVSGFIADPNEQGFGNLLAKLPGTAGDAFKLLATNPDDPEIVNRARHAAEQAGLGVAAEGLVRGVQLFRSHRLAAAEAAGKTPEEIAAASAETQQAVALTKAAAPPVEAQAPLFTMIEQPSKEALAANKLQEVKVAVEPGVPASVLARGISKAEAMPELKLNYAAMTGENMPDMAQQIGASIVDRISAAKRGVMPVDLTKSIANKLGMTPEDLLARPLGEAWSSEKIYGAAALIGQADKDLRALAEVARTPGSSVADGFALRRQLTYYAAMMENFMGAAGEAGRSLNIFNEIHKTGVLRQARAIQAVIDNAGGMDNTRALADTIARSNEFSMSLAAKKGWTATTAEGIRTVEVMNMLFRPATQIRNITGNAIMLAQAAADTKNAQRIGYILGTPPEQAITEAGASAYIDAHYYTANNAFSAAGRSIMSGKSQFGEMAAGGEATAATEANVGHNLATLAPAERFAVERGMSDMQIKQFTESGIGKMLDYVGSATTMPGRFLTAADDFFKVMMYGAKARQMATDEAVRAGLAGDEFANYVTQRTLSPPDNIHLDASDWAMWGTFNNKAGPITAAMMEARTGLGPASYLVFPFMRTPGNIMSMFIQHSPLAMVSRTFWRDTMAGGVDRDMAWAKVATGSAMLATAIGWAENGTLMPTDRIDPSVAKLLGGHITGNLPNNKALADQYLGLGVQRNALRIGDKWVSVSGLGQIAPLLSYAADLAEIWRSKDVRPEEYTRWMDNVGLAVTAIYGSMKDQSYLQGYATLANALDDGMRGREGAFSNWANQTLAQGTINLFPFAGGMMQSTQKLWEPDTPSKNTFDYWSAVKAHTIGLSETVGPVRDSFGEIVPAGSWAGEGYGRWYDWFSPFKITQFKHEPIREELVRLQSGIERIPKTGNFDGAHVDFRDQPEIFDMYQRLAGNELKDRAFGLGLKDYLNAVITGDDPRLSGQHVLYESLMDSKGEAKPGTKMAFIQDQVHRYREMAQQQIMSEAQTRWPDFAKKVQEEKQRVQTFETGRAGIIAPIQDWAHKIGIQEPMPTQYTRQPKQQSTGGGGGFTVPSQ